MLTPWLQLDESQFVKYTRFYKKEFVRVCDALELIPDIVEDPSTKCKASKKLAVFLMLRRWAGAETWYVTERDMRLRKSRLISIYGTILLLVEQLYAKLVTMIDFRRVMPLVTEWADTLVENGIAEPATFGFIDGKAVRFSKPGTGNAAERYAQRHGTSVNLVQRAFYNGHYSFHGAKVQHMVQADSMLTCHTLSIRAHDQRVLNSSGLETQMAFVQVVDAATGAVVQAKLIADQAYARTLIVEPKMSAAALLLLGPAGAAARQMYDKKNMKMRDGVELSFNSVVTKFPHADFFRRHKLFANGYNNWENVCGLWQAMVLFTNLHTCCYGGETTALFGVDPPSVEEYLYSSNHGLMV
jgi:hypothetical protein